MGIQSDIILIEQFLSDHPTDAVRLIENMQLEDIGQLFETLPEDISAQVIARMNIVTSINSLQLISIQKTVAIIEYVPTEIVSIMMRNMSMNLQKEILESISPEKAAFLNQILTYPEGTVGSFMDPFVYTFFEDMSVTDALKIVKSNSEINENYIYIVTRNHHIAGVINVNELLRAKSDQSIATIMNRKVINIFADVKLKLIRTHPGWQDYPVLPVVDNKGILQGIVHYKNLSRYEEGEVKNRIPQHLAKTSSALGELYRIGMVSLIQGASTLYNQPEKKS
jgi:magnesium transporter